MEKIKKWYRKLNLQNKLRISYIALILIPVTVICVVYYEVASQSIIEIAKNNILEGMIKNVQILDRDLKGIQESAQGMNLNNEIYKLLEDLPKSSDFEILQKDKKARLELQKAFSNEYILTANIFTPEFVYGRLDPSFYRKRKCTCCRTRLYPWQLEQSGWLSSCFRSIKN